MHISSVRLGHANNSSSTHSILLNSKSRARASESGDFQYGWDWFHLTTKDDKEKYLSALIFSTLSREMAGEHAAVVAQSLTGKNPMDRREGEKDDLYAYVDHQSVNAFPLEFGREQYDARFMKEFVDHIANTPEITIKGGNDNSSEDGSDEYDEKEGEFRKCAPKREIVNGTPSLLNDLPRDCGKIKLFSRKDGDWWILYNKDSGAKIRVSFAKRPAPYGRASKPELVDVKITDYCPYGCKFCYQDSTEKGKHAKLDAIQSIAYACHSAKVFEVALGGGETTQHPDFKRVLEAFSCMGVTPNFTTFNMTWTEDDEKRKAVQKYCRSFAVSSLHEVKRLAFWNDECYRGARKGPQGTLQIPLGCYDEKSIRKALDAAAALHLPVTLLGFKDHGRGESFRAKDYAWIIDVMSDADRWGAFGADSVFVEQFKEVLKERGVSEKLMVNREGAYSCYVDAVALKGGASSYTKDLHPVDASKPFEKFPYASACDELSAEAQRLDLGY